jgi:DHA3 family macrolide efflux protein-like MFS transporter
LLVRSIGGGIQQPNVGAILPQITPTAQLMRVNSLNQAIQAAVLVASPALAGVLLTFVDLAWILSIDIVTAGVAIAILASIKIPRLAKPQDHKPAVFREIAAAAHHAFHIPGLARVLALFAGLWLIIMPPAQLSPIVVVRLFGSEQWKLATIEVAFSIGMVVGGALLAAWGGLSNRMTMLLVTAAAWSALTLAQGLSPNFAIYAALWAVFGVSAPGLSATSMTVAQEKVAPAMLGRVMGLLSLVMALAGPIGMLAISPLADLVGIRAILVGAGALALLFTAALAWRAPAIPAPAIPAPAIPVPQAEP